MKTIQRGLFIGLLLLALFLLCGPFLARGQSFSTGDYVLDKREASGFSRVKLSAGSGITLTPGTGTLTVTNTLAGSSATSANITAANAGKYITIDAGGLVSAQTLRAENGVGLGDGSGNTATIVLTGTLGSNIQMGIDIDGLSSDITLLHGGSPLDPYLLVQQGATDGQALVWSASNSRWQPGTVSGSGISGSTGGTDNALLRADGSGGSTAQGSALYGTDTGGLRLGYSDGALIQDYAVPTADPNWKGCVYLSSGSGYGIQMYGTGSWLSLGLVLSGVGFANPYYAGGVYFGSDHLQIYGASNAIRVVNGTNAQRLAVYNTYTGSTNYERAVIDWQTETNILRIGAESGSGGGTNRDVHLIAGGGEQIVLMAGGGVKINYASLPTTDPEVEGQLWNDTGTLKVSAGPP